MEKMVTHVERYNNMLMFITENGKQKINNSQDGQPFCIRKGADVRG
jgi:hypothetical protein